MLGYQPVRLKTVSGDLRSGFAGPQRLTNYPIFDTCRRTLKIKQCGTEKSEIDCARALFEEEGAPTFSYFSALATRGTISIVKKRLKDE